MFSWRGQSGPRVCAWFSKVCRLRHYHPARLTKEVHCHPIRKAHIDQTALRAFSRLEKHLADDEAADICCGKYARSPHQYLQTHLDARV